MRPETYRKKGQWAKRKLRSVQRRRDEVEKGRRREGKKIRREEGE